MGNNESKKGKWFVAVLLIVSVGITIIGSLVGFITDWVWFSDIGYNEVFWTKLLTQLKIAVPVLIITTLLVRVYLRSLKNGYFTKIESHEIPDVKKLNTLSWVLSIIFGIGVSIFASTRMWMNMLNFFNATDFNLKDPIFHRDVSFYVFKLDFLTQLNRFILVIIIGIIVISLIYYSVLLSIRTPDVFEREDEDGIYRFNTERRKFDSSNFDQLINIAAGKLMILGIVFYIMLAIDFFLKQFDLLHTHTGVVYGAGFVDVNITLWIYRIIMVLCVVGAVMLCIHMKRNEIKKLIRIPVVMIIVWLVGTIAVVGVQNLVVSPDEINKETKYLKNNIEFTRHAYDLNDIKVSEFPADNSLTSKDIASNSQTISNIRINDYEPVKDYYNQTQSIRHYYDFNDVDIDRYKIDGKLTQTYLSPREINEEKINSTWLNNHLKYTHGYGVTLSKVNAVTANGQPDVLIKNIPPESSVNALNIKRPEIYFGEQTKNYVVVNADEQEFDYPDGNENKYTTYKGKTGIKLNPVNRLLFALREKSLKLLVSSNINSNSKIIINRNVIERVEKIMPYLIYEKDPYMTIVDGKLYWIIDAYTTSSKYPYSEPYTGEVNTTNYIRNSVKVVVDAYDGTTDFYIVDEKDPIARTCKKIYPSLFKDFNMMPKGIKEHIRYPNTLFKVQAQVYTKYHMNDAKVFYQNEDLWDISKQIYGTKEKEMDPSYYIFELPGEKDAEFINMVPFTPKSKQNMTALMMARNDGENYGKMVVYTLPKNNTIYGPMQVEAQRDQNTEISKEFSLWNSSGSTYRRGDMFVIPIENSIMYIEPVYLEASNQAIPEVKRVIVSYNDRISYAPTLDEALSDLFGEGYSGSGNNDKEEKSEKEDVSSIIGKANEAYDNAVEAQKNGDWKSYGDYLDELSAYLDKLEDIA